MSEKTPERKAPSGPNIDDLRSRVAAWLDAVLRPPEPELVPVRVRARR